MNINGVDTSSVNLEQSTNKEQCSLKNNTEKEENTKITFRNAGYVSALNIMQEKIEKKYRGIAAANRSMCKTDTELRAFIWDKYYNKNSSRYVKGLSKEERDACYNNEYFQTKGWKSYCFLDPVAKKDNIPVDIDMARENQFNRNKINAQIADLFAENQIVIPKDVNLSFVIEPKEYHLTVSGTEDEKLKSQIEEVLNKNENAKNIFKHMVNIQNENAGQFSEKKLNKYRMRKQIKEETGYDLDDLEIKNNSFYTKDGTDIYNMVCKVLAEQEMPRDVKSAMYVWYREQLKDLSKFYKRTPELILRIDFCNGSLYDVNQRQQYGTGQTEWIDEMLKYRSTNGYM